MKITQEMTSWNFVISCVIFLVKIFNQIMRVTFRNIAFDYMCVSIFFMKVAKISNRVYLV